jgi:retron-type reverse transcriptase
MRIQFNHKFEDIITADNLLEAWKEFVKGKRGKLDVQNFGLHLMDNVIALHFDLANQIYQHGPYVHFNINDPKPRNISKAAVRDRLLHHAIYRKLYPFFERTFIADSFSCRIGKGTHKALLRFHEFTNKVSSNNKKTCWVLKCDIKKFFANINHQILLKILTLYIPDKDIMGLMEKIINSFNSADPNSGLPLGNLTSQLFVNIYMNEFDQFVKHKLKARYYIRYADDFVIFSTDKKVLENQTLLIKKFLKDRLSLELHPKKISIKTLASGIDFLGWVNFPKYKIIRTKTKKRILKKISAKPKTVSLVSYLGLLRHGKTQKVQKKILDLFQNSSPA